MGAHGGGFGRKAKALWDLLVCHAKDVAGRDWRHSWTAMSFSSVWLQKLSIAIAKETAIGTIHSQSVLGEGSSGGQTLILWK